MALYQHRNNWIQLNGQQLTFTTASTTNTSALPAGTTGIRIVANQACWVEVASSAAAVCKIPAGEIGNAPCPSAALAK